jgi:phosphoribosylglycinamide formyltransferase-1
VCEICLALPGVAVIDEGDHATFRVGGRVFAYFLDDHHGDGIVSVCVKSALGESLDRARLEPDRYYLPAYIGSRGWFGMRLDRPRTDWREAAAIVVRSYRLVAPKRSLRQLDGA